MSKIVLFSVVYSGAEKYLEDFFVSLENQSFKGFDIVIFNDGLKNYPFSRFNLNIEVIDCNDTPAKIRERGIHYLKEKYKVIVFGDCDDYFELNRIETVRGLLMDYDIVVNDLTIISSEKKILVENYFSKRIKSGQQINFEYIFDKNIFGMSNSAVNTDVLEDVSFDEIIAVDWYLFSILLFKGYKSIFTNDTVSYYRQHSSNFIGFAQEEESKVLRDLEIKLYHYGKLSKIYPSCMKIYKQFKNAHYRISNCEELRKKYFSNIKINRTENPLWWEKINVEGF